MDNVLALDEEFQCSFKNEPWSEAETMNSLVLHDKLKYRFRGTVHIIIPSLSLSAVATRGRPACF